MTEGRSRRLLDVTAYTTLDFADATVEGHGWEDDAVGVVDVSVDESAAGNPEGVTLSLELDGTDVADLPQHATHLELSAGEAETLASALTDAAATVAEGGEES